MLKGYSKCHPSKDLREPITLQLLKDFSNDLKHVNLSNYEALLFSTAFSVAFFGFMRVGELVVHSKDNVTSRVVQLSDVILRGSEVRVYIRFSKTDQNGRSVSLIFTSCQDQQICPVALLYRYIQQRRCIDSPLFCNFNGQPLTRFQFSSVLAKVLKFLGIKQVVRPHSFRIGATNLACQQNILDQDIQAMGRWSAISSVFKRYIRLDKLIA